MGLMVFGHRGAGHNEPENTLRAIRWALTHGIDGVEVDLRLTKDKRVILIHDESVDRTTDGTGFLGNLTLNEVRKLDAGMGERIPTLEEVISLIRGRIKVLLHIKDEGVEEEALKILREAKNTQNYYLWLSKRDRAKLRKYEISVARSISGEDRGFAITGFVRSIEDVKDRSEDIIEAHRLGYPILVVVHPELDERLQDKGLLTEMGVDGVITDYPEDYMRVRGKSF